MNRIARFRSNHPILFALIRTADVVINSFVHGTTGHTLSAWYGKHQPQCPLCRFFHKHLERWHCENAAFIEGLITYQEAKERMKGDKS